MNLPKLPMFAKEKEVENWTESEWNEWYKLFPNHKLAPIHTRAALTKGYVNMAKDQESRIPTEEQMFENGVKLMQETPFKTDKPVEFFIEKPVKEWTKIDVDTFITNFPNDQKAVDFLLGLPVEDRKYLGKMALNKVDYE